MRRQTSIVLLVLLALGCVAAVVVNNPSGGGGGGVSSDQASVIASNAAKSLMVWTNGEGVIHPVIESNLLVRWQHGIPGVDLQAGIYTFSVTSNNLDWDMHVLTNTVENGLQGIAIVDDGDGFPSVLLSLASGDINGIQANPLIFRPTTRSGSGAPAYLLSSAFPQTNVDDVLITIQNASDDKFTVNSTGAVWSASGMATNQASFGFITTNLLSGQTYTNFAQRGHVVANIQMTNILAGDVSSMALIVDQNGDGTWDTTNGPVRINGVALSAGEEQLFGLLQPGARFAFTNQSAGTSPGVSIRAGSCQWSRW